MTVDAPASLSRRPTPAERAAEAALAGPGFLRRAAGRMAARRGLYAHGLACAPQDPYVLARAGFFNDVPEDAEPAAARLAALAGLGMTDALLEERDAWSGLSDPDRVWIAGLAAAWDPLAANLLLTPDMALERAACLLAEELDDAAVAIAEPFRRSPERSLLLAAAAAAQGEWSRTRTLINAAFEAQGLEVPLRLPAGDAPGLDEFDPHVPHAVADGPLVSVVLAVKDGERTLPMAMRSLLRQTWRNLEVIVVDDGSTDATRPVAEELAREDRRVRVVANARAPGAYGARNCGAEAAAGDYLGFHDADDWAHPRRIEHQVRAIGTGRAAAVSKHFRLSAEGRPVAPRVFPIVRACPISVLVRADAARFAGPMEEVPLGADSEYLARLDLLFGRRNVVRSPRIHLVAGWAAGSLSAAEDTGLVSSGGREARASYERDWRARHAERLKALTR